MCGGQIQEDTDCWVHRLQLCGTDEASPVLQGCISSDVAIVDLCWECSTCSASTI